MSTRHSALLASWVCLCVGLTACQSDTRRTIGDLDARPLYTFTEDEVDTYIPLARRQQPNLTDRIIHLARKNIGQPYEIFLLGEFPYETHDPDPLYCLGRSDCLTFCEHMYSMALADDWWSFLRILQRLRYKDGEIGMLTRNHYTIADWNPNNSFLFEDITQSLGDGRAAIPLRQVVRRAKFFTQFGIGQDVPDQPVQDAYIPTAVVPGIAHALHAGDFINIIRGNDESQYCGHTGLVAIGPDGAANFLHSARPAVQEELLVGYLARNKSLGIKVLRLRPDAEARMAEALADAPLATPVDSSIVASELSNWPLFQDKPSYAADWKAAMKLQAYRLESDTPPDDDLQAALVKVDEHVRAELQIAADQRAFGVLDLSDLRLALLGPDEIFYGASVPKIGIVLAYLAQDPQRALNLDPTVMRELQLVIKRSDNELAAKYSQIVGIDAIQELLQSKQYKFYDADSGGGIWCGKHYGLDVPREVDPIGGHSHAVTVRQCLRYYLMLEQGRLVNPRVCAVLKEIFAAPHLDFHTHNFIDGLRGRDVQVLRKSGSWEDWHLDTARVQNGERAYLLAGATEHPKGEEYLSRMAAEVDTLLCGKPRPPAPKHQLITYDSSSDFAGGSMSYAKPAEDGLGLVMECPPGQYESPVIETDDWFNEAVVSWNVDTPGPAGFIVELRVGRAWDDSWSPWLHVGAWGPVAPRERVTEFEAGRIDKDYFRSNERYDRIQYRIHGDSLVVDSASFEFRVNRITACVSDLSGLPLATRRAGEKGFSPERKGSLVPDSPLAPPPELVHRRLPVPFRSQKSEKPEIAGRICSPTSLSMVMEYRGVNQPTAAVAEAAYDPVHDIYGNWPANVQAAYSFGVPGYLARFTDWGEVERMIAADQPLIASIRVKEPGDLAHAPYKTTKGHLIVLCGFDADGNVEVNDPAASTPETGMLKYARADLEKVWMKAAGGLAYVLLAPSKAARVQ